MTEGYDFGNARVRARRAELLNGPRYRQLAALDVPGMVAALSETPYRPDLEAAATRHRGHRLLDEALSANLARTLRELAGWYTGRAAAAVTLAVSRWDHRNLRAVLRGQMARRDPGEIRAALVPAGSLGAGVLTELAGQPGLRAAIDLMVAWGVPSRPVARAAAGALAGYEATGDFGALELAVERAAATRLAAALTAAEPEVARALRMEVDLANVVTAARLHAAGAEAPGWDATDAAEHFLPGGSVPATQLARAASSEDRGAAIAALAGSVPAGWAPALARWAESGDPVALDNHLDAALTRSVAGMFATADPLGPAVPLAYVWAKENEVRNLRTIAAGLDAGMPPDLIEEELVILW